MWIVLAVLVALSAIAWWQPSQPNVAVAVAGTLHLLALVAWPCLAVAAVAGDWRAVFLAIAVIASQLLYALPSMHPWSRAADPEGPWRLRVYVHNVLYTNRDLTTVLEQVASSSPDVVALIELSHQNVGSVASSTALDDYPFHVEQLSDIGAGVGIWSRIPMVDFQFGVNRQRGLVLATLQPPDEPEIQLVVVHTSAPVSPDRARTWVSDLETLCEVSRGRTQRQIVLGDFNATLTMRRMRAIVRTGLRDAGTTTGNGWRMTWPAGPRFLPGLMRIDHLLHSPELTATSYELMGAAGSDHRPLLVALGTAAEK